MAGRVGHEWLSKPTLQLMTCSIPQMTDVSNLVGREHSCGLQGYRFPLAHGCSEASPALIGSAIKKAPVLEPGRPGATVRAFRRGAKTSAC